MEENPILGIGENNIGIKRYLKINQSTIGDIESPSRISKLKQNDTHNGYIQLLVSNGILCFVLFQYLVELLQFQEDRQVL